uniref:Paired amphipathic helix protein Sin3a n=1 Tax=Ciona savignyi TaxID=51511 RepID=H2YZP4_CIOSA
PQTASQIQAQQHQFQKLKVEDALSYLDQVKFQFGNQPQVYTDFLDIMKEFKSQSIDTPGVIARVSHLFNGHPDLIVGFNTFLPPGYKIEVSANDQVSVTGPNMIPQTIHPLGVLEPGQSTTTIQDYNLTNPRFIPLMEKLPPSYPNYRPIALHPAPTIHNFLLLNNPLIKIHIWIEKTILSSDTNHRVNTNTAASQNIPSSAVSTNQPQQTTNAAGQPVEFNHAINYVNKIKNRFQGQPDIYKAFLEILHKYQKEQRNVKDSNGSYIPSLSESEVYAQVARLFQNDADLLREFGQFLPDAGGAVGASTSVPSPSAKVESILNDHGSTVKKPSHATSNSKSHRGGPPSSKRPGPTIAPSSKYSYFRNLRIFSQRTKSSSLKDVGLAEASKHGTLSEFAYFDKVRRALRSTDAYENFVRCLLLYNNEVIGRAETVQLIQPFLIKFPELFKWFKEFMGYKESPSMEMSSDIVSPQPIKEKHEGIAMEIDYTTLKRLGSSYRALPSSFQQPKCTGRDDLCHEVLNDTWVSFPSWSEDSQFVTSKKTPFEEHIYRCEDERYERQEAVESGGTAVANGPHITLKYEDKSVMDDAASLIIHHVKRQSGIHKDDKQKVKQVMYQVLPDLYFSPRGNQPSDDDEEEETKEKFAEKSPKKLLGGYLSDDALDGSYHLFFGNANFYLFVRLHHVLCERLLTIQRRADVLADEDLKEKKERKGEMVADMLRLRQISGLNSVHEQLVFTSYCAVVQCGQYEDTLREMFTIHAYTAYTMDRLVQNIVRQLQHIVQDDICIQLLDLFHKEENNSATGGALVSQSRRLNAEAAYQRKAEHLSASENCFKLTICQKQTQLHVGIELLDTDEESPIDVLDVTKWSEYLEHYVASDDVEVTPQMKEQLAEKPVFLQRNANHLRRAAKNDEDEESNLFVCSGLQCKVNPGTYKTTFTPGTGDIMYRHSCFNTARQIQKRVGTKLHKKFEDWLVKWEQENVSRDMGRQTNNWLLGKTQ